MIVRFEKLRKNTIAGKFYVDFKYFKDFKLKTLLITFEVIQKAYKFEEIFNIASSKYIAAAIHINFCKSFANRFLKSWS